MGVSKTQVVKFIRKGDKGDDGHNCMLAVSPALIVQPIDPVTGKSISAKSVTVTVKYLVNGVALTNLNTATVNTTGATGSVTNNGTASYSDRIEITLNLPADKTPATEKVTITVTPVASTGLPAASADVVISYPKNGDKGEKGATLRGPQAWSDCATGYAFQAGNTGEQWKDVVLYNGNYYSCVKSHTKTNSNYPGSTTANNNGYWQLGDKIELVATKILLATYALVENLGVTAIDMKDAAGNILFQAKDGNVTCKTGTFENVNISGKLKGSVRNPFVSAGDSFDTDYSDNVVMISSGGGWVDAYSLPWDASQSGRRITLVNYKWGSTISEGQAGISAPSGKYFYINGVSKTTLNISREAVELLGYGTATTFYGWIVLRRTDLMTNYRYGRELKVLAFGSVTSSGGLTYRTFDGSTLSCTKQSATGRYLITMPSGWFSSASHCTVLLTGVGYSSGSSSALIKASLVSRTTTTFLVGTSDDASANDGAFDFVIINNNDWIV